MHNLNEKLPPGTNDYIIRVSDNEDPELSSIRLDTEQNVSNPQMMIGPQVGHFLQMLIKISSAQRCLEIGTFTGYSALTMAMAVLPEGSITTLERDEKHAAIAQTNFNKSAQGKKIQLMKGNAVELIPTLQDEFDFVFIDADKRSYPIYFDLILPKVKKNGLIVADNTLYDFEVLAPVSLQAQAIHEFNLKAKNSPLVETQLITIRDGLMVMRKI